MANDPDAAQLPPGKPPRVRLVKGQEVNLGCGTLILIALIVLFFSAGGSRDHSGELRELRDEVRDLKRAVDEQTGQIRALRGELDRGEE